MPVPPPGTDWAVQQVVKITDGDTVRVIRRRTVRIADGLACDVYDETSIPIRVVTIDTPERGQPCYAEAAADVAAWLAARPGRVRVETWPGGGFDRLLGDLYDADDRGSTLSQWMLRERGWLPYIAGR